MSKTTETRKPSITKPHGKPAGSNRKFRRAVKAYKAFAFEVKS